MAKYTKKTDLVTKPMTYTLERCIEEAKWMEDYVNSQEGQDIVFISELCLKRGYHQQWWTEQLQKWNDVKIHDAVKRIEQELENRLAKRMLKSEYNATGAIFTLKNKYKWVDKHINENTNVNINEVLDEQDKEDTIDV